MHFARFWSVCCAFLFLLVGCTTATPPDSSTQAAVPEERVGRVASAYTSSSTVTFGGYHAEIFAGCDVCGGDFGGNTVTSTWANGVRSFTDPSPAGEPVRSVSFVVRGTSCDTSAFTVSLNGGPPQAGTLAGACSCGNCNKATVTFSDPVSVPGYVKGGTNTFQLTSSGRLFPADVTIVVSDPVATSTLLTTSPNPSVFSAPVTLTARVSSASGTPTGNVLFTRGATTLGSAPLDASGVATLTTSTLATGSQAIVATYEGLAGAAGYLSSASAPVTQVIAGAATATTVAASPSSSVLGQSVTLTANVTAVAPATATPTGTVQFEAGGVALGSAALTGDAATLTTTALPPGSPTVTATYVPDVTDFVTSAGSVATTVAPAATTLALATSPSPSVIGQAVTLTATVTVTAPGGGTPSGQVVFRDGTTLLGDGTLTAGVATFVTAALAFGPHDLRAEYVGGTSHRASTGSAVHAVLAGSTTTALAVAPNPATYGATVVLTATVRPVGPAAGIPAGAVTFFDGATQLGSPVALDATGAASGSSAALTAGTHALTAVFGGFPGYTGSTSAPESLVVTRAATTTTLVASSPTSAVGDSVTFTVDVASPSGTPGGTVELVDGNASLGSAALVAGRATFAVTTLAVGAHILKAVYPGANDFAASASDTVVHTVGSAATSVALTTSGTPSVFGQPVTFTAAVSRVAGGPATPDGTVEFFDGSASLGTAPITAGVATLTTGALTVGDHTLIARYLGTAAYQAAPSDALTQRVDRAATATAVLSSANPAVAGQQVTLTVTVAPLAPGAGVPRGDVTVSEGTTVLATVPLAAGVASVAASLPLGPHALTAAYAGDGNFAPSSSSFTQTVDRADVTIALTSSPSPSRFGQAVTLTATVAAGAPGTGAPSGTVTFREGATVLGTGAVSPLGTAAISVSTLSVGARTIKAEYGGDARFAPAGPVTISHAVEAAETSTTVVASQTPSAFGTAVTFTATVVVVAPGAGTPEGNVTFRDGNVALGTATIGASGTASFSTSTLAVGTHPITVVYGGSAGFGASTSTLLAHEVGNAVVTMAVTTSPSPSTAGQAVIVSVTVSAPSESLPTPTGTILFREGTTDLGTSPLAAGSATLRTSTLGVGNHTLSAIYSGDGSYGTATASVVHNVGRAETTTTLIAAPSPSTFGQAVTLTATVAASAAGTPTGTVTFREGSTTLGTASVTAGVATFTTATLAIGARTLAADYAGNATFAPSTSSLTALQVDGAVTTTGLVAGPLVVDAGGSVTFTASVTSPIDGAITGTITFREGPQTIGTAPLGAGGVATLTSTLSPGTHAVLAEYGGDATFARSASSVVTVTVRGPGADGGVPEAGPDASADAGSDANVEPSADAGLGQDDAATEDAQAPDAGAANVGGGGGGCDCHVAPTPSPHAGWAAIAAIVMALTARRAAARSRRNRGRSTA